MLAHRCAPTLAGMRVSSLAVVLIGCSVQPDPQPVRVDGEGVRGLVRTCEVVEVARPLGEIRYAASVREWRELRESVGGLDAFRAPAGDFLAERLIAVPLTRGIALSHVEVSSEEGVDVVTVDVAPVAQAATAERAALLFVARRPCQLAVVLRDDVRGAEQTLAVYPASR